MAVGFMAGSIISKMVMDTTKWSNSIKVVKKDADTIKGKAAKAAPKFKALGRGMTIAGAAIVGGLAVGIKAFKKFDLAMTESLAIMGDVSDEMQTAMKTAAMEMSGESKFAADQLAESYFFLASAGIDAAGSIKALPVVTKFAQAGAFELAKATDLLTDAQSALGLSSKDAVQNQESMIRVSDVLVKANTLANGSVAQFSEALTNRAGPSMRAYGVELEEGVAVLAAFADQGVKGSEAGMQFAIVMRDMQKAAMENKGAFEAAGIAVFDANGNLNNMGDIVGQLEERLGGMSAEQKKAELTMLGFQERSQAALLTLVGTSDNIKRYEENLRSAGGITEEVSNKQLKSLSAQMTIAKNNINNVAIKLGEQLAPTLISVMNVVSKVGKAITDWANDNKKLFKGIVIGVGVLGGLLAILGPIIMMIPPLVAGIGAITVAGAAMTAGLLLIVAAAAALVVGIGALTSALKKAEEAEDRYNETSGRFEKKLKGIATQAGLTMVEFQKLKEKYKGNINVMALAIKKGEEGIELQKAMNEVGAERVEQQEKEKKANEAILPTIEDLIPPVKELHKETEAYTDFLESMGIKTLKEKGDRAKELEGIVDDLTQAYNDGKISLHDYRTAMKEAKDEITELGTEVVETAIPQANNLIGILANAPAQLNKEGLVGFPGKIAVKAKEGAKKVKTIWGEMTDQIKTKWGTMWTDFIKGGISLKSFGEAFKKFSENILTQFLDMVGQMIAKWTFGLIEKMVSGTKDAVSTVVGTFKDVTSGALNLAKGFSPTGAIATGIGAAVGTFLGGLLGGGPSKNDTRLIKDNTWLTQARLVNVVANLGDIKWALWNFQPVFNDMKLTLWDQTETLHRIENILDTGPTAAGAGNGRSGRGGGEGAGVPLGTQININKIQNSVNINGLMVTDREYARDHMLPEILHALKQRANKKQLQKILGIA